MRIVLTEETLEFVGKYFGDLSKAVWGLALASYFFKGQSWLVKIGFVIFAIALFWVGVIILEKKKGGKK